MLKTDDRLSSQIEKYLDSMLLENKLKAGDRLMPESEIGKMFNASNKPVRAAMQRFVSQGILEKVRGKGTFVRKTYQRPNALVTNRIGLLYFHDRASFFASSFYTTLFSGVEAEAQMVKKSLLLRSLVAHPEEDQVRMVQDMAAEVDGFVLVDPPAFMYARLAPVLAAGPKPAVVLNTYGGNGELDAVVPDNEGDTRNVVDFLVRLGHTRILFAYHHSFEGHVPENLERRARAFATVMMEKGLAAGPAAAMNSPQNILSNNALFVDMYARTTSDEPALTARLTSPDRPTAIFCGSDQMAFYAYQLAQKAGMSVPDDLTVVGYDDIREAGLASPGLTTIHTPLEDMGRKALARVCEKIREQEQGRTTVCRIVVPGTIIERQSHKKIADCGLRIAD